MTTPTLIPIAQTNKLIRQVLKEVFPGIKFSVYAQHTTTYVDWPNTEPGPTRTQVSRLLWAFRGTDYDDSSMCYVSRRVIFDGHLTQFGSRFILANNGARDFDTKPYPEHESPTLLRFAEQHRKAPF